MTPTRVTTCSSAHEQLLYFTSTSLLADDRGLVFISDRDGQPNLWLRDFATADERQLSANRDGRLKSYVYFDGTPYAGLGLASVSLDAERGVVYYLQGRDVCAVAVDGERRVLARLPDDQMTAFTHVSADGRRLCVPTTDERALDGRTRLAGKPPYDIDERVRREGLSSWLRVFDTATGAPLVCERVPSAWVTHVQFCPTNAELILYNHEWPSDCGIRRMWLFDGSEHRRLRDHGAADWACHEMWERDGSALIYHGGYHEGAYYVGRVRPDGSARVEVPLAPGMRRYGHFTVGAPGELVTDGYWEQPGDPGAWAGAWIARVAVDWEAGTLDWQPLCRHGSSWDSQDSHPHPIFDHARGAVYFTSDRDGRRAVWRVEVR